MIRIPLGLFIIYIAGNMTDDTSLFITGILGLIIVISGSKIALRFRDIYLRKNDDIL